MDETSKTIKEKLLALLEENRGRYVSGSVAAKRFGVTRAAVWKAVQALSGEGHLIECKRNKGYLLSAESSVVTAAGIEKYLKNTMPVYIYDEIDSMNNAAKRLVTEGLRQGLVVARTQTQGRGRRGRSFYSPYGSGVYFSLILVPRLSAQNSGLITTAAAVAAAQAIETVCGKPASIKWINDIYADGKKVCGILTECAFGGETGEIDSVVIGIGINVTTKDFPDGLGARAGCLLETGGCSCRLIAETADRLTGLLGEPDTAFLGEYRRRCFVLGRTVTVTGRQGEYRAEAETVLDSGALVVRKSDGTRVALNTEEVSVSAE